MFETSSLAFRAAIASLLGSCFAVAMLAFSHGAWAQASDVRLGFNLSQGDRNAAVHGFDVGFKASPWALIAAAGDDDQRWEPALVSLGQRSQPVAATAHQLATEPAFNAPAATARNAKLGLGLLWPWSAQRALRLEFENRGGTADDLVRLGVQMRF